MERLDTFEKMLFDIVKQAAYETVKMKNLSRREGR